MTRRNNLIILLLLAFLCMALSACSERGKVFVDKEKIAIENIGKIAMELDKYFDTYAKYPENIQELKEKGFLGRFPLNPYNDKPVEMIEVRVSTPTTGDFSYLKIYRERFSDEIMYYVLILWGPANYKNEDILDPSFDYDNFHFTVWEDKPDGEPDRYLTIIKSGLRTMPEDAPQEK